MPHYQYGTPDQSIVNDALVAGALVDDIPERLISHERITAIAPTDPNEAAAFYEQYREQLRTNRDVCRAAIGELKKEQPDLFVTDQFALPHL